tara:strand:- start:4636 stop:4914 length:279 start_codon:yes stop_codon:yes gene_type:complete
VKYKPIKFLNIKELCDELDDPNHPDHDIVDISLDPPYCNMTKDELEKVRMEEESELLSPDEMSDEEMVNFLEEETNKRLKLIMEKRGLYKWQ